MTSRAELARAVAVATWMFVATAAAASAQFEIGDTPRTSVGVEAGAEIALFAGASLAANGDVFVLDRWGATVLHFSAEGELVGTIGRRGNGPGEFQDPFWIGVEDDTVRIADSTNRRISSFGSDGSLVDELSMRTPFVVGQVERFADGAWILRRQDQRAGVNEGFRRDTVDYLVVDAELRGPQRLARMPAGLGARYRSQGSTYIRSAGFTPAALADTHGVCAYITTTDESALRIITRSGERVMEARFEAHEGTPVTDELRRAYVDWSSDRPPPGASPPDERERRRLASTIPFASHVPLTMGLLVDPRGLVWLQDYGIGGLSSAATVLSPDDASQYRASLPGAVQLLEVGIDYILTRRESDLGEDVVEVYPLSRDAEISSLIPACEA